MTTWGTLANGTTAHLFTLTNANGMSAQISDYGGIVVSLTAPDRHGRYADVVLGFKKLEDYVTKSPYFGCICGRVGNRIAHGRFTLDGTTHTLVTNNSPGGIPCHLHGGTVGFDKIIWQAETVEQNGNQGLRLRHVSPHGDEGYPGTLDVTVTYWLTADDALRIDYVATTDRATPVNLTNHSYFNLKGEGHGTVMNHVMQLHAPHFTPTDAGLIPTGELRPVAGTPFDFTTPTAIGERIDAPDDQLRHGRGYDHNFVLANHSGTIALAAVVSEPTSGRIMETWTTEPGVQCYTGNWMPSPADSADKQLVGKSGKPYHARDGFCLETQHFPDSPNQPSFPSIILRPGQVYRSTTIYRFRSA